MLKINLSDIKDEPKKHRHITFRLPEENFQKLKQYEGNVSNLLRYLVELYLLEKSNEEKINKWTSPRT